MTTTSATPSTDKEMSASLLDLKTPSDVPDLSTTKPTQQDLHSPSPSAQPPSSLDTNALSSESVASKAVALAHPAGETTHTIRVHQEASLFTPALSAVLVVAGWIIVNKTQANRERRKQLREAVSALQDRLAELEKTSIEYHSTERQCSLERDILSKLGRFEKGCAALTQYVSSQRYWRACDAGKVTVDSRKMQEFRKAITLAHFADEHTGAIEGQADFIQEIELAVTNLHESLDGVRLAALD